MTTTKTNRHGHHQSRYDLATDFKHIKEALADASSDVRGRANEILAQSLKDVKTKSTDIQENVAEYVAEKPFKSIGFALLIGFIVGFFLRR